MKKEVVVNAVPQTGIPAFQGEFERINVILGANGSGKTKLLQHLAAHSENTFGAEFTPVHIEGGRAVAIPPGLAMDGNSISVYSNPKQAREQYRQSRRSTLAGRIGRTFVMLRALEDEQKKRHSDAVTAWLATDRTTPTPGRVTPPFTQLMRLFREVFPLMELFITESEQLYVKKGDASYPVSLMSDGEKQVFTLLADIAVLTNERSVFLVDEPELNLHPTLAERLWVSIEEAYPEDMFVYTSHSLPFALRTGVDSVFAIGHGRIDLDSITHGAVDLRPFLGAIPGIVRSKHCLFVEGDEASFDAMLYRWLLNRDDVDILPVGSCSEVVSAAARAGIWRQISTDVNVYGLVDRDFKAVLDFPESNVLVLPMHEAESLLCHPDVIIALQNSLSNSTRVYSSDEILDALVERAKQRLPYVIAQRTFARAHINLKVSLAKSNLATIKSVSELRPLIQEAGMHEADKAHVAFEAGGLMKLIDEEEALCNEAISKRDVNLLLALFEGKQILNVLYKMAGAASPLGMLKAATKHINPGEFPHLQDFRAKLAVLLSAGNS